MRVGGAADHTGPAGEDTLRRHSVLYRFPHRQKQEDLLVYTARLVRMTAHTTLRPRWWRRWLDPHPPDASRAQQKVCGLPLGPYELQLMRWSRRAGAARGQRDDPPPASSALLRNCRYLAARASPSFPSRVARAG